MTRAVTDRLDQFYTRFDVAAYLLGVVAGRFDLDLYQLVEPSAGTGAFFRILRPGSWGYDREPKCRGVVEADFLEVDLKGRTNRQIIMIGNPPFGKNSSLAVDFFNHGARTPNVSVIAMIFPRTFRKGSIQNRLDRKFHLIHEEDVVANAFLFQAKLRDVPTVFQIWVRRQKVRDLWPTAKEHPDLNFTTADRAHFAMKRVGAGAGRVHDGLHLSRNSHYFIEDLSFHGDLELVMHMLNRELDAVARDAVGNPSLSKAELVRLYSEHIVLWDGANPK